jgi:gliding motility-associated lipoprotein GldH
MKQIIKVLFVIATLSLVFVSCDRNRVYEQNIKIDDYIWDSQNAIKFEFEIKDTAALHNVYINVRHASVYPYNNLWLFIKSSAPNGQINVDTLECKLADEKGKWLGEGLGDIWDIRIPWKKNVRFPNNGKYIVEYNQAMRIDKLPGIMEVGLRVEKIELK